MTPDNLLILIRENPVTDLGNLGDCCIRRTKKTNKQTNKNINKTTKKECFSSDVCRLISKRTNSTSQLNISNWKKKQSKKSTKPRFKSWTSVILRIKHPPLDKCYQNHWFIHWTLLPTTTGAWISPCWRDASRSQYTKRSLHEFLLNTLSDTDDYVKIWW